MVQSSLSHIMGQNSSLPIGRRKSLRSSIRRLRQSSLSHTFAVSETVAPEHYQKVNINTATEEELMTLPDTGRDIAKAVVEHRKAIGRFRKVEDLALVPGIGAERLERLRMEVCVSNRRNQSCSSSRAQSLDSLRSGDSRVALKGSKLININKASVFELQCVNGVTQEIAAAIVHHRERKGPFAQVGDLVKLKCIDNIRLDNISRFLTIQSDQEDSKMDQSLILTNGFHTSLNEKKNNNNNINGTGPLKLPLLNGLSLSSLTDIFELLSAYSPRPIVEEIFNYNRNGELAIRLAYWNLHDFSKDKAGNLGVKEVVCRTILENGWSIVALQDVVDTSSLKLICDELNKPKLRRVSEWKDKNHNWNFCMLDIEDSQLGFIYDFDGVVEIELLSLNQIVNKANNDCDILIGNFLIDGEFNLQLVNVKLNKMIDLVDFSRKIGDLVTEADMALLFVDYSKMPQSGFCVNLPDFQTIFPLNLCTTTSKLESSFSLSSHTCNILNSRKTQGQLTGVKGVVRKGLCHLGIPNGWNWGGFVSPYCPIWVELFVNLNVGTAL